MCCLRYSRMVVLEWPNCLNGKSFLRGWGRGMTNFQLCGSGNWERMIPWWRLKRGDFAVSVTSASSGTASLIFEVDQISLQLKCQICRARHSLQCISHCSTRLWLLTSDIMTCHMPHTLCPPSLEHIDTMSTSRKTNLYPVPRPFIPLWCNQQGIPS